MKKKLTNKTISDIKRLHAQGTPISDIVAICNVSPASVYRYSDTETVCRACGKNIPVQSKFCMFCGAQMLTKKDLVLKGLQKAITRTAGTAYADEICKAIRDAMTFIEGVEE